MTDDVAAPAEQTYNDAYFTVRDGLRLHYRDYPGGSAGLPPLLCLHGLTRNVRDFAELAGRYAPRFRVIALDFRGRGDSDYDPLPARYTPLTYAGDVLELLNQLAIPEAIFVGTSLGGLTTMILSTMAPQRIAAAILNDVGPEIGDVGIDRILAYLGRDVRFRDWDEAADAIAVNQGPSFPDYGREDWRAMARRSCRERDGEVVFDYDMAIAEPFKAAGPVPKVDMWPFFEALAQKPLLAVRGEISVLLTAETFERMREVAPQARFVTVPGIGHAPELNEPAALEAIDAFLNELPERLNRSSQSQAG